MVVDASVESATEDLTSARLEPAWLPTEAYLERSRLRRFMTTHGLTNFEALLERSTTDLAWFWQAVCEDLQLEWYRRPDQILDTTAGIAWTRWFPGGKLNYVHNALDKHAPARGGTRSRSICEAEEGDVRHLTYGELLAETNRCANALRSLGIRKGDRVAAVHADDAGGRDRAAGAAARWARSTRRSSPASAPRPSLAAAGLPGQAADHRRRLLPPRPAGPDEGVRRRGGRASPSVEKC